MSPGKQMPCDAEAIAIMPVEGTPAGVSRDVDATAAQVAELARLIAAVEGT